MNPIRSEIPLLEGERWWGGADGNDLGAVHDGPTTLRLSGVPLSRLPRYELAGPPAAGRPGQTQNEK